MLDLWHHSHLQTLNTLFSEAGFSLRIVGGAVRDAVLGVPSKDVDLCTNALPEETMALAARKGFRCVPTGLQHGTVTLVLDGEPYEITTLRIDTDTDGRHATVEFTRDFHRDAARRDFTWNAMSVDAEGNLYDYFDGVKHLEAGEIHFVGDAAARVHEDYLRVLRFFRFAARMGCVISADDLELFSQHEVHKGLLRMSKERVWAEMQKLLVAKDRVRVLAAMQACGVGRLLHLDPLRAVENFERTADPVSALSFLVASRPDGHAEDWRLSRAERSKLVFLARLRSSLPLTREWVEDKLVDKVSRDTVVCACQVTGTPEEVAYHATTWTVPVFPVTGEMLQSARGLAPGPVLGTELRKLREVWRSSRYTASADALLHG